ncbi:MAG: hypothetical protein A2148_06140 [Chloroflexi bacterium RBG_16_68_14]|nr:MAG: hypothetical protein A2148_06140 [Chloroflexi bacterium RBG_16_68_14]
MSAQVYLFGPSASLRAGPSTELRAGGERLTPVEAAISRPLRWAAWHPDGSWCLLVGNGGTVVRYDPSARLRAGPSARLRAGGQRFEPIASGTKHNLRGAAFSPDGRQALLVGNQGALLLYACPESASGGRRDGDSIRALPSPTTENLRRAAWHPSGDFALVVGNGGTVLRYQDPSTSLRTGGALTPVPGDRAHTLRALAWRPDGAYALVGAYASRYAGYPRPHPLYKCDGLYLQALLGSDEEDDFVAVDWHPDGRRALIAGYAYDPSTPLRAGGARASNKLLVYDGAGFAYRAVEASGALLGAAWHPGGEYALLCGEGGALLRYADDRVEQLDSGTRDNLVGPFWRPDGSLALLLRGPGERVYTV